MEEPDAGGPDGWSPLGESGLRAVFDAVQEAILVVDPETRRIVECNERACVRLGIDREEARGLEVRTALDAIESPDGRERIEAAIPAAAAAGDARVVEALVRDDENEQVRIEARLRGATVGGEQRVVAVVRDVTERERRRQQLEEEHEQYAVLVEQSPAGVGIVQDEEFKFVNRSLAELTGRPVEDLEGTPFYEVIASEDRDLVRDRYEQRMRGQDPPARYEVEVLTPAEERRIVDLEVSTVTFDGDPATMATFNDVTERRERERELRETTLTLEALLSALPDVVTLKDDRGMELEGFDSSAPENLLAGDPSAAAGGQDVAEVFPPATAARVRETIRQAVETDAVQTCEYQLDVPAGTRWFEAKVAPLEEPIDGTPAVVWVARDITERKQHERELRRQNERLERFANVVSHDLRNPLSVAMGHAQLLDDDPAAGYDQADDDYAAGNDQGGGDDHAAVIEANLERMEAIIDDVLTLAREGESVDDPGREALSTIAREAWRQVETAGATLRVVDGIVEADRDRSQRLFENLFRNSVQHGGADVAVRVGPLPDGFFVEDDGPGIPADDRSRVFEAGYTTAAGGTGLGLNIVREIAAAHGWTVDVVPGKQGGVRFEFEGAATEQPADVA